MQWNFWQHNKPNINFNYLGTNNKFNFRYTRAKNVWGGWFLSGNHDNHQNLVQSILPYRFWLIFMGMKQKIKMADSKSWDFQNHKFSIFFCKRLSHINSLCINLSYLPKNQYLKKHKKNITYTNKFFTKTVNKNICIFYHNFWTNYDSGSLRSLKWLSAPQFCERYLCSWQKIARICHKIIRKLKYKGETSLLWHPRWMWSTCHCYEFLCVHSLL